MKVDYNLFFSPSSDLVVDDVSSGTLPRISGWEAQGGNYPIEPYVGQVISLYNEGKLIGTSDVSSFASALEARVRKIANVSDEVISSLRRRLDYSGHYIAFLLDQLSEKEFSDISEKLAIQLSHEITPDVEENVRLLFYISKQSYSPSELSDCFKIDLNVANEVIDRLRKKGLINSEGVY